MRVKEVFWGAICVVYAALVGANLYSILVSPLQGFSLWTLGVLLFLGSASFAVGELRRMYPKDKDYE